ncbi:zwei Ig domain protein zig-8-like isoform X2 [Liolophura sinensis]|uniref:zwei Ig domain protein zig-8-like isoform X2 n=1 Tax=Liolophura sinensis TaxID=3198878 RepID=UPI0031594C15
MRVGAQRPRWTALLVGLLHLITISSGEEDMNQPLLPQITDTETEVTVNKGKTAKLKCTVINQGTKTVIWKRVDEPNPLTIGTFPYVADTRISTTHNKYKNIWTLHINRVQLSDAGRYECQVSTKDHVFKHFRLLVTDEEIEEEEVPRVVLTGKKYVEIGQPIELICNATGEEEPPQDLDWFHNGDKINSVSGSGVEITKYKSLELKSIISKLLIEKAKMTDKGDYICRVGHKDDDAASILLFVLNAATNNVKREKDVDKKSSAEKKTGKEVKEGTITYVTGKGSGFSTSTVSMATHPVHLITWTFVLIYLFQYTLQGRGLVIHHAP